MDKWSLSSKHDHHYHGDGANVTANWHKISDVNGASILTFAKVRSYGEENCQMGQDQGYVMGHYDGNQNNHTLKLTYSTDTEVTLGAKSQPKSHFGQSSGTCSTAAASIVYSEAGVDAGT